MLIEETRITLDFIHHILNEYVKFLALGKWH